jgi:hypothetical protein
MSSTTRKGDGTNRYGLETPKVSRVLSTTPVSKDAAFDMIARFLHREKQEYMSTTAAAGAGSTDETLVASTSAWNGLRRVCNSLLPSQEFNNNNSTTTVGNETREPVSAWWGDTPTMGQGRETPLTSTSTITRTTALPRTKMEPVSPVAVDHKSSLSPSSGGGGFPDTDTRDQGIETYHKSDKKAAKQAKKEAKKVKKAAKAAKKIAKKAKKEKKDKTKVKHDV